MYIIGVDSLKATIMGRLRAQQGAGTMHFPLSVNRDYFEQLNAEFVRTVYSRGRPVRVWERRKGRRAEALDCAVYAYAALHGLMHQGVHPDREAERIALMTAVQERMDAEKPSWLGGRTKGWLSR
jgi:phage terminase large subunit GpA-like protein